MCHSEIDDGQGEEAVDYQAGDHSQSIHGNSSANVSCVRRVHNLCCQQEDDSHWGIPVNITR